MLLSPLIWQFKMSRRQVRFLCFPFPFPTRSGVSAEGVVSWNLKPM